MNREILPELSAFTVGTLASFSAIPPIYSGDYVSATIRGLIAIGSYAACLLLNSKRIMYEGEKLFQETMSKNYHPQK